MIHDRKCDMIGCSMVFFHFSNSFANIGNDRRQWSWDDNKDYAFALTSKSGLICCKCFDVRPATTGCIHFLIFSLGSMHLCFGCNPRDPNGRSVVKKFPILTRNPLKSLYERLRPRRPPYQGLIHRNPWYNRNSWTGVTKVCKKTPPW